MKTLVVALLLCHYKYVTGEYTCPPPTRLQGANDPTLGVMVSDLTHKFQVKSRMYTADGDGKFIQEYFSRESQSIGKNYDQGLLKILSDEEISCYYRGFLTNNQSLIFQNDKCNVAKESQCASLIGLDTLQADPDQIYPIGPTALWLEAGQSKTDVPTYAGKSTRRNVEVDKWVQCLSVTGGTLQLTFYAGLLKLPSRQSIQAPIFLEVNGEIDAKVINRTFDFYDYQTIIPSTIFQVPTGIACNGLPQVIFPEVPQSFSFHGVISESKLSSRSKTQKIQDFDMAANWNDKTVQIDSVEDNAWTTWIGDYLEGVAYKKLYDYQGEKVSCTVENLSDMPSALTSNSFPYLLDTFNTAVKLGSLYRLGKGWIENIPVDIYQKQIGNQSIILSDKRYHSSVATFYFTSSNVKSASLGTNIELVQIQYTEYLKYYARIYKVIKMRISDFMKKTDHVNLASCFQQDKTSLAMTISQKFNKTLFGSYYFNIITAIRNYIISNYHISNLRLTELRNRLFFGKLYVSFVILPAPKAIQKFTKLNYFRAYPSSHDTFEGSAVPINQCAEKCIGLDARSQNCVSFYHCTNGNNYKQACYLSQDFEAHTLEETGTTINCDFYHVSSTSVIKSSFSNADLVKNLKKDIKNGKIAFNITADGSTTPVTIPITITKLTETGDWFSGANKTPLHYEKVKDSYHLKSHTAGVDLFDTTATSQEACIRHCDMHDGCESVSYCIGTSICAGSSLRIDTVSGSNTKYIEQHLNCALFNRPYLKDYRRRPALIKIQGDFTQTDVTTEASCAKLCTQYTNFTCRSYQYCFANQDCLLLKRSVEIYRHYHKHRKGGKMLHRLTKSNTNCIFGKRNYASDFRLKNYGNITKYSGEIITSINYGNCTEACYFNDNCAEVTFCYSDKTCIISPRQGNTVKTFKIKKAWCAIFQKINFKSGSNKPNPVKPGPAKVTAKKSGKAKGQNGITTGAMAGLCIGMLIVGLVLIAGIYVAVTTLKNKKKQSSDINIIYTKDDN